MFSYGAVYNPWLITRAIDGELVYSPPDGAATGVLAGRSLRRGAWIAPANEILREVIGLSPAGAERSLELLTAQINQITQEPEGFMALNADTLSEDPELRPINVRRLLMLLRREALKRGARYVFEPNNGVFRRQVQAAFETLLAELFVRGAFAGDTPASSFEVVTDETLNNQRTRDRGEFHIDLKVAPSLPLSFVTVRLVESGAGARALELV
jgi:phage tail sheath protein FI